MIAFARSIAEDVKPDYGISYTRKHRLGPLMYAIGICQGLGSGGYGVDLTESEREEAESISRWGDGMMERVWQKGILRDVYLWNFLTHPHLVKPVGGVPFKMWIQQDVRRGTVNTLCDGISLWQVDEANLPSVRQSLHQASLIFDWKKHL
jgi:hypothetical protein